MENKLLYPRQLSQPGPSGRIGDFFAEKLFGHNEEYPSISLSLVRGERSDVTLVAYGGMAPLAVEAASNVFMQHEIVVKTIVPSLIKPFPLEDILPSARESERVVIVEEAVRTAGWGAEMASQIYEHAFEDLLRPMERVGAMEVPIPSSGPLEKTVLPQVSDIEEAIYRQVGV